MVEKLHKFRSMLLIIIIPILFSCASAQFYTHQGVAHFNKDEYDEAISDCNKALKINPKYAVAYNPNYLDTLAAAYARVGDFTNAIKWQERALEYPDIYKQKEARERLEFYRQYKSWPSH